MILSITMNPSVDISYPLNHFILNKVNRVADVRKTAGGKGLNVTRGIHLSGYPVLATGIVGGTTGDYIKHQLTRDHINYDFYQSPFESRNCIAILHEGQQTEILEAGPEMSEKEVVGFKAHLETLLSPVSVITISGSLPVNFPIEYYENIIEIALRYHIPVLLDCSGETLKYTINSKFPPFLIKPNHEELGYVVNRTLSSDNLIDLQDALKHECLKNIPFIVVSLGKDGALARYHNEIYKVDIPKIDVVNPVGSGDVTLGGLAVGLLKKENIDDMLKRAMTMGMLNALEAQTGLICMAHFEHYFNQVTVKKMN